MDLGAVVEAVTASPVARLATIAGDGRVDLVPITYAMRRAAGMAGAAVLVSAVDHKPKRTTRLRRLDNIRAHADVTVLVDHYADDWTTLWWVRLRGLARVLEPDDPAAVDHVDALVAKYPAYREIRPTGPVIELRPLTWQWWSAADGVTRTEVSPIIAEEAP